MRKIFILFLLALAVTNAKSQNVAINTDSSAANPNAILDIKSPGKGILIPRMDSVARLAIPATKGLMVYDTTTSSFWYNDGAIWRNLTGSGSPAWSLTGNSGTVDGTNFIGTTDNVPFSVRMNNIPSARIDGTSANTAWGYYALSSNTGFANTAIGAYSLPSNTNGWYNTATGCQSLHGNTVGTYNTALGFQSLYSSTNGSYNTVVGGRAMEANITGGNNTSVGAFSLWLCKDAFDNTAVGMKALYNNNGYFNTGIGYQALYSNTTGTENVATGDFALTTNFTGSGNVATGSLALKSSFTGSNNTAIGTFALDRSTSGSNNTGVGAHALNIIDTGSNNTALGVDANVSAGNLSNTTALGYGAVVNASNKVRIGNAAVTVIEGQVPFTTPSDGRFKYNVREDVKGLDFILKLRPVTYQFDGQRLDDHIRGVSRKPDEGKPDWALQAAYREAALVRRTGFIAQEVEQAADQSGYNFSGIVRPRSENEHYSLSYESFVVPLVKAVQEQQRVIDTQNKKLKDQEALLGSQEKKLADIEEELIELKQLIRKTR